jgi:hypothetical protein
MFFTAHTWLSALPYPLSLPIGAQPVLRAMVGLVIAGVFVGCRAGMGVLERMIERY